MQTLATNRCGYQDRYEFSHYQLNGLVVRRARNRTFYDRKVFDHDLDEIADGFLKFAHQHSLKS